MIADRRIRFGLAGTCGDNPGLVFSHSRCADRTWLLIFVLDSQERWPWVLRIDGVPAGYCSCSLGEDIDVMKLEQLYLLAACKGQGLGRRMLRHVEAKSVAMGRARLYLTVNKGNTDSIAI